MSPWPGLILSLLRGSSEIKGRKISDRKSSTFHRVRAGVGPGWSSLDEFWDPALIYPPRYNQAQLPLQDEGPGTLHWPLGLASLI